VKPENQNNMKMTKPKYMLPGVEASTAEAVAKAAIQMSEDATTGRPGLVEVCEEILRRIKCPSCGGTEPNPPACKNEWHIARNA
jgi:hypothetical protein